MTITPIYAGLLGLVFIVLSMRVIKVRRVAQIGLGDGGNQLLLSRQRAQGNFAEYVPIALILMALAELQDAQAWIVHAIGLTLIAGRIMHAYGLSQEPKSYRFRIYGMSCTFASLASGALANLLLPLATLFSA